MSSRTLAERTTRPSPWLGRRASGTLQAWLSTHSIVTWRDESRCELGGAGGSSPPRCPWPLERGCWRPTAPPASRGACSSVEQVCSRSLRHSLGSHPIGGVGAVTIVSRSRTNAQEGTCRIGHLFPSTRRAPLASIATCASCEQFPNLAALYSAGSGCASSLGGAPPNWMLRSPWLLIQPPATR
jgi:hypothetical protein